MVERARARQRPAEGPPARRAQSIFLLQGELLLAFEGGGTLVVVGGSEETRQALNRQKQRLAPHQGDHRRRPAGDRRRGARHPRHLGPGGGGGAGDGGSAMARAVRSDARLDHRRLLAQQPAQRRLRPAAGGAHRRAAQALRARKDCTRRRGDQRRRRGRLLLRDRVGPLPGRAPGGRRQGGAGRAEERRRLRRGGAGVGGQAQRHA